MAAELAAPAAAPVAAIAEAARAAHGQPCARSCSMAAAVAMAIVDGQLVDLYLLVDDYAPCMASVVMRWLNRLVPPNVYYLETDHAGGRVRAKYALVSLDQFERRMGPGRSILISGPASRSRPGCSGRATGRSPTGFARPWRTPFAPPPRPSGPLVGEKADAARSGPGL